MGAPPNDPLTPSSTSFQWRAPISFWARISSFVGPSSHHCHCFLGHAFYLLSILTPPTLFCPFGTPSSPSSSPAWSVLLDCPRYWPRYIVAGCGGSYIYPIWCVMKLKNYLGTRARWPKNDNNLNAEGGRRRNGIMKWLYTVQHWMANIIVDFLCSPWHSARNGALERRQQPFRWGGRGERAKWRVLLHCQACSCPAHPSIHPYTCILYVESRRIMAKINLIRVRRFIRWGRATKQKHDTPGRIR